MYMDNVSIGVEEMNTNNVREDALYKVIVVGDCAVGKSIEKNEVDIFSWVRQGDTISEIIDKGGYF